MVREAWFGIFLLALFMGGLVWFNYSGIGPDYIIVKDYKVTPTPIGNVTCESFTSQKQAQEFFNSQGGPATDTYGLDRDHDGVVCESLP